MVCARLILIIYFQYANNSKSKLKFTITVKVATLLNTVLCRQCNGGLPPLHGQRLTVGVYGIPPFLYQNQQGVIIDVIKVLQSYHKFNCEMVFSDDWFKFGPNGTIGGTLGLVIFNRYVTKTYIFECSNFYATV